MLESVVYFGLLLFIAIVAWVGQWGKRNDICRYVVYGMLALSALLLLGLGVLFYYVHKEILGELTISMGACAVPAFIPPFRRWLSKTVFRGMDPTHPAHIWAIYIYFASIVLTLFSLTVFYIPSLIIQQLKALPVYQTVLANTVIFVVFSFLAMGVGINLSFKQTAIQLGLKRLTLKQAGLMVLFALVIAGVIQGLESVLMTLLSPQMRETLQEIVKALHLTGTVAHTVESALIVGLAAGIGEEILFRGLIQSVFGIVPTAILFALIHTHYGPTVLLLELFVVGLLLGYIRKRWNTTAAIIVHGGFDFFAILSSLIHH